MIGSAGAVALQADAVGGRVDRVERFVVARGEAGVLADDDGAILAIAPFGVEVAILGDTGERHVRIGVINDRGPLVIAGRQNLGLEPQGAPAENAFGVVEIAIDGAGVDHRQPGAGESTEIVPRSVVSRMSSTLTPSTPKKYCTPMPGIQVARSTNWKPSFPLSNQNHRGRLTRNPAKATTFAIQRTACGRRSSPGRSRTSAPRSGV